MDAIKIVTTFDTKEEFSVGRQTDYIMLDDLKKGLEITIDHRSSKPVKNISVQIVDIEIDKKIRDVNSVG